MGAVVWPDLIWHQYEILYARYLAHSLLSVVDIDLKDKVVLDLCGGNGRLALESVERGALKSYLVDKNEKMFSSVVLNNPKVYCLGCDVRHYLSIVRGSSFDGIFCQQAINYWLNSSLAKRVSKALRPDGFFIFNTFNKKPSEKPLIKKYRIGQRDYIEFSWYYGEKVHHIQVCPNSPIGPHYNIFCWISPFMFREILGPYFKIRVIRKNHSSYYICTKK